MNCRPDRPTAITVWIVLCAYLSMSGWTLSAVGWLNAIGYAVVLAGFLALAVCVARRSAAPRRVAIGRLKRRFSHLPAAAFAILAALALLGGLLYAPSNHDALAYRVPRILNWLAEERWHWIPTFDSRANTRGVTVEWLYSPLMALTKSDRLFFLPNWISFLMLPRLTFCLFTQLGIRPRVAHAWMWLVPTGYCFVVQAGSIASDLVAAPLVLAAIFFALRASKTRRIEDLALSAVAAGLMTGVKATNLPILLVWLVAAAPAFSLLMRHPLTSSAAAAIAIACSFAPTAALNVRHCGDWSGTALEAFPKNHPALSVLGNCLLLPLENVLPPLLPTTQWWNSRLDQMTPGRLGEQLRANFEKGFPHPIGELRTEEAAGMGVGLVALLAVATVAAVRARAACGPAGSRWRLLLLASPYLALLVLMAKLNTSQGARMAAPYYLLLMPAMLTLPGHRWVICTRWWRVLTWVVILAAFGVVILSPARPLWPAQTVARALEQRSPDSKVVARLRRVLSVYAERPELLRPVTGAIPIGASVIGTIHGAYRADTSLWKPYGERRVIHLLPHLARTRRDIRHVVIEEGSMEALYGMTLETWLPLNHGRIIHRAEITELASQPPQPWCVAEVSLSP